MQVLLLSNELAFPLHVSTFTTNVRILKATIILHISFIGTIPLIVN